MTTDEFQPEAQRLRPSLMAIAQQHLSDAVEAEDVVQDVLLKLWLMREHLRMPMAGLAKVLVRNQSVDLLRRRHATTAVDHLQVVEIADEGTENVERMMKIVEALPDMQQTVIRLRHLEGMGMAAIAALTGSTEVAVRKMLSRARKAVRDEYLKMYK